MSNAENGARRGVHLRRRPVEGVKKPHSRKLDHYTKRSKLFFVDREGPRASVDGSR